MPDLLYHYLHAVIHFSTLCAISLGKSVSFMGHSCQIERENFNIWFQSRFIFDRNTNMGCSRLMGMRV